MKDVQLTIKTRRVLIILAVILLLIFLFWSIKKGDAKSPPNSCTEAKAEGLYNIPSTSPYYQKRLDRNDNGIACEL